MRKTVAAHADSGSVDEHVPSRADIGTLCIFARDVLTDADQLRDRAQEIIDDLEGLDELRREALQ